MVFRESATKKKNPLQYPKCKTTAKKWINWQTDLIMYSHYTYNYKSCTRQRARGQRFQIQTQLVWKQLGCTCHLVLTALSCHLHVLTTQPDKSLVVKSQTSAFSVQIKTLVASYFERNNRFSLPSITPIDLTRRFPTGAKMNVQQKRKCQLNEKFSFQASFKSTILQSCFFCNLFIFSKNTWDWEHEVVIYCSYIAKYLRVAGPVGFCHK